MNARRAPLQKGALVLLSLLLLSPCFRLSPLAVRHGLCSAETRGKETRGARKRGVVFSGVQSRGNSRARFVAKDGGGDTSGDL